MSRKLISLVVPVLCLLLAQPVSGQHPDVGHSEPYWRVAYWNNMTMHGSPAIEGTDVRLDWDWGAGSPRPEIGVDHFSARWIRYLDLSAGSYRFSATSDDGIRVYVDNSLIIDEWNDHAARTFTADVILAAGHHLVTVEFYENMGDAVAKLSWWPVSPHNWRGEYYSNRWLGGVPQLVRDDTSIDFNWGYGAPAPVMPVDGFSVRWTRTIHLDPGLYRFFSTADDGVRLWVNNHLLVDAWRDQSATVHSGTIYLSGDVPVVMEYYENGGVAVAKLTWSRTGGEPDPPPADAIIVDDRDPGFHRGGSVSGWRFADSGYRGTMTWTRSNYGHNYNYNWARWYPTLSVRRYYEVLVHIPVSYGTTSNARYWISHYDGYTLRRIDQSANAGRWVSLGTYRFRGTRRDYVSLADITYEPYLSRTIAFDAMKWEPR